MRLAHVDNLNSIPAQASRIKLHRRDLVKLRLRLRRLMRGHAAELLVINQLPDRRLLTANRTLRILPQFELAELHLPRIKKQQAIDQ
jgi:hypothetical protein